MSSENKNQIASQRKSNWKHYWPLGVVAVLVILGWFLATSLFDSQAAGPSQDEPAIPEERTTSTPTTPQSSTTTSFWTPRVNGPTVPERAVVQRTNYNQAAQTALRSLSGFEADNINENFQVLTTYYYADESENLDYAVYAPDVLGLTIQSVAYQRVAQPDACVRTNSWQNVNLERSLNRPAGFSPTTVGERQANSDSWFLGTLPLRRADRDQYYCFKVRLAGRRGTTAERHFVTHPISLRMQEVSSIDRATLLRMTGLRHAAVVATNYQAQIVNDWDETGRSNSIDNDTAATMFTDFQVTMGRISQASSASYVAMVEVPNSTVRAQLADVTAVRYLTVRTRSQCQASAFTGAANRSIEHNPVNLLFFAPSQQPYCLQVKVNLPLEANGSKRILTASRIFYLQTPPVLHRTAPLGIATQQVVNDYAGSGGQISSAELAWARQHAQHIEHLQNQVQILTVQDLDDLFVSVTVPHVLADGTSYSLERFTLGKVNRASDCSLANFEQIEQSRRDLNVDEWTPDVEGGYVTYQIPVTAADRGAFYCFKAGLAIKPDFEMSSKYAADVIFVMSRGLDTVATDSTSLPEPQAANYHRFQRGQGQRSQPSPIKSLFDGVYPFRVYSYQDTPADRIYPITVIHLPTEDDLPVAVRSLKLVSVETVSIAGDAWCDTDSFDDASKVVQHKASAYLFLPPQVKSSTKFCIKYVVELDGTQYWQISDLPPLQST